MSTSQAAPTRASITPSSKRTPPRPQPHHSNDMLKQRHQSHATASPSLSHHARRPRTHLHHTTPQRGPRQIMSNYPAELHSSTPPAPPPKGPSSTISTPRASSPPAAPEPVSPPNKLTDLSHRADNEAYIPSVLHDKSTQDLADMLADADVLNALAHTSPDMALSHQQLVAALSQNMELASALTAAASRLAHQRSKTQAQLLATHALERQWHQKQSDMDEALAPFSPASLYQRLGQGVQEQAAVAQAMEESFLEGGYDGAGVGEEREVLDWIRRYREAKALYYLRQERKERWDEGRVGGWR